MKNNYFFKRVLSAAVMLMASSFMWAYDFEVDGIYYNVNEDGKSVEVTYYEKYTLWGIYWGDIVIPSSIIYDGKTYSVTRIGEEAFNRCPPLISIKIPNSVTSIGDMAFSFCSSLTSVEISNSMTSIGEEAFMFCSSLTSVEIPKGVTSIGNRAFARCSALTSIAVANDNPIYDSREACNAIIETASNTLIAGFPNTVIPNSVINIGDYAFYCSFPTSIEIPNSVTSIGDHAFSYSSLTSIEIPNSVTSIGDTAFYFCSSLTSIEIPNSVASIGNRAFSFCSSLASVTCYAEVVPELGNDVFYLVPQSEATLYVPASALEAYKAADQWKDFGAILPIDGDANGITSTTAEQEADATYYTLDGVNVKTPTKKGIYIKNGKKVFIQ